MVYGPNTKGEGTVLCGLSVCPTIIKVQSSNPPSPGTTFSLTYFKIAACFAVLLSGASVELLCLVCKLGTGVWFFSVLSMVSKQLRSPQLQCSDDESGAFSCSFPQYLRECQMDTLVHWMDGELHGSKWWYREQGATFAHLPRNSLDTCRREIEGLV